MSTLLLPVLAHTNDWLVINKPEGIGMHRESADDGRVIPGLLTLLQQQQNEELWPVHRLDKVTSGILLVARNASAAARLSGLFAQRQVKKFYIAQSLSRPRKKQGWIKGDMEKTRNGSWRLSHTLENPAITRFESSYDAQHQRRMFLLHPLTGKTHQLRVALKSLGSPIEGDERYKGEDADRTYLHAMALEFEDQGETYRILHMPSSGQWGQIPESWMTPQNVIQDKTHIQGPGHRHSGGMNSQ